MISESILPPSRCWPEVDIKVGRRGAGARKQYCVRESVQNVNGSDSKFLLMHSEDHQKPETDGVILFLSSNPNAECRLQDTRGRNSVWCAICRLDRLAAQDRQRRSLRGHGQEALVKD